MSNKEPQRKIPLAAEIHMLEIYVNYPAHNQKDISELRQKLRDRYNYRIKPDYASEEVKRLEWIEIEINTASEIKEYLELCNTNIPEEQINRILANYKKENKLG